ncbi:hypothetical protein OG21DRAFT_1506446 [Imleria badia]|nr:hypothetical protein OG21DRAFT_1506446 [Imleria badia]
MPLGDTAFRGVYSLILNGCTSTTSTLMQSNQPDAGGGNVQKGCWDGPVVEWFPSRRGRNHPYQL